jgi:hypothetical protein
MLSRRRKACSRSHSYWSGERLMGNLTKAVSGFSTMPRYRDTANISRCQGVDMIIPTLGSEERLLDGLGRWFGLRTSLEVPLLGERRQVDPRFADG